MPGNQRQALLECCECGCQGCCLPTDVDGNLEDIPWEISAPSCPEIDGLTGVFNPIDAVPTGTGPCGACGTYQNVSDPVVIPGEAASGLENPVDFSCLFTPCGTSSLCFVLACETGTSGASGIEECCGRLVLWIGSDNPLAGDDGSRPQTIGGQTCDNWIKVLPNSCACDPLSAEFSLSGVAYVCDELDVWVGGPCDGELKCCQVSCPLGDATLVI